MEEESSDLQQLTALVAQDFDPVLLEEAVSEERLLELLSDQVAWLIEHRLEYLMSLMYRLDVDELKVDRALSPAGEEPAHIALARLILDRQRQRVFTKKHYRQQFPDNWDWDV
ncbi:MAG: hypothetical protein KAX50_00315 [Saprospiraceae bacterium]|jgi:hypothetical protein|nr:hypothetical protein [Saprospiraceae bacterium]